MGSTVNRHDRLARGPVDLDQVFDLAPWFLAVLRAPDHIFELVNPAFVQLVGARELIGVRVCDALPEVVSQGFISLLDTVVRTGQPYSAAEVSVLLSRNGNGSEHRVLNFVCQPVPGPKGVDRIVVHGVDVTEHVRTREALAAREARYRLLVENTHDKIAVLDEQGCIQYDSPVSERLLGWSLEEVQGRHVSEFLHPREREAGLAQLAAAMSAPGIPHRVEHRILRKDGSWRHFETVGLAIQVNGHRELVLSSRDITERRAQDDELTESRERFRLLAELIPQLVWSTTPDGYHDYFNQRWYDYTGMARTGDQGWNWKDYLHPDDYDPTLQVWQRSLDTGEPYEVEYRFKRAADGEYRWFIGRALPLYDEQGRIMRWFGTCTDVHDERMAREEARESRERFRAVTLATRDVIWDWDVLSGATVRNENTRTVYRLSPEQMPDTIEAWRTRVHPDDRARVFDRLNRSLASSAELWTDEYRFICGDGASAHVLDRGRILRDEQGKAIRVIGSMIDVTESHRMQEQLVQSQKMEAVGKLAGGIAHDFNNLLTVITNYSELLLQELGDARLRVDAEGIRQAATRAASLTRQLLAFSRRQVLQPHPTDLNRIVVDMKVMLRRVIGEHVILNSKLDTGLRRVFADPSQMEQVVLNLVVNARDAMPGGGTITIRTDHVELAPAAAGTGHDPGTYVRLRIADTGTGMDAETAKRVFEPFFTTKPPGEGTGLGLSTVHGIITQSGGYIELESTPGQGTEFTILLPVHEGESDRESVEPDQEPPVSQGATILLVEDEEAVRGITRRALTKNGMSVIEAQNGQEAVKLFERHAAVVDLVLTDLVMPGMGGREVAARVRTICPDVPMLFMSGYAADQLPEDMGDMFLEKPFTIGQLLTAVAHALAKAVPRT